MLIAPGDAAPPATPTKPALYAFFKNGCPTCQLAFPIVAELERRYGGAIPVVAVAQDEPKKAGPWLAEKGFAGKVIDDSSRYPMSRAYGIVSVPTLVLVDELGVVASVSEAWSRERYNEWARDLGERTGRTTEPVSTEDDGRPAFKPG